MLHIIENKIKKTSFRTNGIVRLFFEYVIRIFETSNQIALRMAKAESWQPIAESQYNP